MGFIDKIKNIFKPSAISQAVDPQANYYSSMPVHYFDGEKTPYELGYPLDYALDYQTIRSRSWEAFLKRDVVQNIIRKYVLWIIGSGLKIQAKPIQNITGLSDAQTKEFEENIETNFRLFANIKESTFNKQQNLHELGVEALKNAIIAGDVLCVTRYDGKRVNMEIIDGANVQTPLGKTMNGTNKIIDGVEIDSKGTHIAYYVLEEDMSYKRIPARIRGGRVQAWLFIGLKHKINDVRGMSLLTAVLETAAKMDRYKEATIGAAEENAKIPFTIEHDQYSDGENPLAKNLVMSANQGKGIAPETASETCDAVATKVALTTQKTAINMPVGAKLNRLSGNVDVNYSSFIGVNIDILYTTIGMPPEVAMDKFGGTYSGSRAALKSWEYKMFTDRVLYMQNQYYQPFYNFWLDISILSNKIISFAYVKALMTSDFMILAAFRNARFIGATVPHIDPVKEVTAERNKLGPLFINTPLTTLEQAVENLNSGDAAAVINKAKNEKNISDNAGFGIANTSTSTD